MFFFELQTAEFSLSRKKLMPGGRKPKYELNENIEYEGKRSNYRYGKCIKCERIVQAQNWHLHLHEDWLT
jgi:hypothetical protein